MEPEKRRSLDLKQIANPSELTDALQKLNRRPQTMVGKSKLLPASLKTPVLAS